MQGTLVFDMMDERGTLYLQKFENQGNGVIKKCEYKQWKFDEKNNLRIILQKFREILISGNNQDNLNVARVVNKFLEECK